LQTALACKAATVPALLSSDADCIEPEIAPAASDSEQISPR
jgi:hypothetical protein